MSLISLDPQTRRKVVSLSTSTSTGLSGALSSVTSLSTELSTTQSNLASMSTNLAQLVISTLSQAQNSVASLSTSASTGFSSSYSATSSLSTSTSTGLSTASSSIFSLSTGLSVSNSSIQGLSTSTSSSLVAIRSSCASLSTGLSSTVSSINRAQVGITQWVFTPTTPITVSDGSQYNLFSNAQFVEGSPQVVKSISGDGELFIAVNESVKSTKFVRLNGDEDVSIRCQLDFSFGGGQTRTIEIALMRPTLTAKVAPFLIARTDNNYPINASVHQTFAIGDTDNFYVHGVYPQIDNQSGGTMTITKISVLIKRIFENEKI